MSDKSAMKIVEEDGSVSTEKAVEILRLDPLRIGVSTRALFDLHVEHGIFKEKGVTAYAQYQRDNENNEISAGVGYPLVSRLLSLNPPWGDPFVEVILLSRNSPDLSLRALESARLHGLPIKHGSFTSGRALAPYLSAWKIDLFLTGDAMDAQLAINGGAAGVHIADPSRPIFGPQSGEVRVAFDGDAVIFSDESDQIYKSSGLETFLAHEVEHKTDPMKLGPLGNFLKKLSYLRSAHMGADGASKVRIAVVTARNAPAHARVVQSLTQNSMCNRNALRCAG
ncbi:MAG: 5'-nucleotidase, partial [Devosia sp.]